MAKKEEYNLDEKGGVGGLFKKKLTKIVIKDDIIDVRHFSSFNSAKMKILEVNEDNLKLEVTEKPAEFSISTEDSVVLSYFGEKDFYVMPGKVKSKENDDPLTITVNIYNIEKSENIRKQNKRYVSFPGIITPVEQSDKKIPMVVKAISLRAIKIDCKEEFHVGDDVSVTVSVDKKNKFFFKGEIVRKNKVGSMFEYGIEVKEITESNSKLISHCVSDIVEVEV